MTRGAVLSILFGVTVMAGCVNTPVDTQDPFPDLPAGNPLEGLPAAYTDLFPRLLCKGDVNVGILGAAWTNASAVCNHEMTPINIGNEVTIAVNPKDPMNVVGGGKDYTQPSAGQCVWDGIYTTKDGGKTWINGQVPGSNWARLEDSSTETSPVSKHWCATDPVVAFGPNGEVYYAVMGYQCDPVSASPTGDGVAPQGGLNDWAFNCVQMYVMRSNDGGVTWPQIVPLEPAGSYPATFHDREWIAVDQKTGAVYISWISAQGNWFYRSTDGGMTWEGPQIVSKTTTATGQEVPGGGGGGTMVAAGPDGMVLVSWSCGNNTRMVVSRDGGETFDSPIRVPNECSSSVLYPNPENGRGLPRTPDAAFPAIDASDGPFSGNIYFASRTAKWGRADIGFTRSEDGGKTWSELKKLNDDTNPESAQFFAAIGVNPNGVIDVAWYDQRNDPDNYLIDLYYTYSLDGGETWAPNVRVTEVATDPKYSHHQNGMIFIGDYIDIDSSVNYAHPIWVDTRHEVADVYTAWIERPAYPIGHTATQTSA